MRPLRRAGLVGWLGGGLTRVIIMSHRFCSFRLLARGGSTENGNMVMRSLPSHGPADTAGLGAALGSYSLLRVGVPPLAARTRRFRILQNPLIQRHLPAQQRVFIRDPAAGCSLLGAWGQTQSQSRKEGRPMLRSLFSCPPKCSRNLLSARQESIQKSSWKH